MSTIITSQPATMREFPIFTLQQVESEPVNLGFYGFQQNQNFPHKVINQRHQGQEINGIWFKNRDSYQNLRPGYLNVLQCEEYQPEVVKSLLQYQKSKESRRSYVLMDNINFLQRKHSDICVCVRVVIDPKLSQVFAQGKSLGIDFYLFEENPTSHPLLSDSMDYIFVHPCSKDQFAIQKIYNLYLLQSGMSSLEWQELLQRQAENTYLVIDNRTTQLYCYVDQENQ